MLCVSVAGIGSVTESNAIIANAQYHCTERTDSLEIGAYGARPTQTVFSFFALDLGARSHHLLRSRHTHAWMMMMLAILVTV
jgi:hypothetical protein